MVNYICPRCGYETSHNITIQEAFIKEKKYVKILISDDNLIE